MRNVRTRATRKAASRTVASEWQSEIQNRLHRIVWAEYQSRKAKNASYSLRAYARALGLFPSALSEFLNGKRPLSVRMGEKILERLSLPPDEAWGLLNALKKSSWERRARRTPWDESLDSAFTQLDMDTFHVISDWYYFAILSLAETTDFRGEPAWISERLGITAAEAKVGLQRLLRLGLLQMKERGRIVPTNVQLTTGTDVPNLSLRRSLHQNLDLARVSLDRDSVEMRDFSSITMAIDPARLPEAKKLIKKFRRNLCRLLESGPKREVYNLNIELFPLTVKKETSK